MIAISIQTIINIRLFLYEVNDVTTNNTLVNLLVYIIIWAVSFNFFPVKTLAM